MKEWIAFLISGLIIDFWFIAQYENTVKGFIIGNILIKCNNSVCLEYE